MWRRIPLLEAEGYTVSAAARAFLQRYAGLTITLVSWRPGGEHSAHPGAIWLDIGFLYDSLEPTHVTYCEQRLDTPLCLIGMWDGHYTWLMMAPAGEVYGCYMESILLVGRSGDEAILNMISGAQLEQMPPDPDPQATFG